MARIPLITSREGLVGDQLATFDAIVESRGEMLRPFEVLLHSPDLAMHTGSLGAKLRFESDLLDSDRELLILTTAICHRCPFEWDTHLELAVAAGVSDGAISFLQDQPGTPTERESALIEFTRELCTDSTVGDDLFEKVHGLLGNQGIVEAATTVGYYTMLAYVMNSCGAC